VNKYDLVEDYELRGNLLEDFMQQHFLDVYANTNGFISAKRISAK
jgi:hypothetical protein